VIPCAYLPRLPCLVNIHQCICESSCWQVDTKTHTHRCECVLHLYTERGKELLKLVYIYKVDVFMVHSTEALLLVLSVDYLLLNDACPQLRFSCSEDTQYSEDFITFLYALLMSSALAVCGNSSTSYKVLPDVLQTMQHKTV